MREAEEQLKALRDLVAAAGGRRPGVLLELLQAVAKDQGVWVGPDMGELDVTLLEARRAQVLRERGPCRRRCPAADVGWTRWRDT